LPHLNEYLLTTLALILFPVANLSRRGELLFPPAASNAALRNCKKALALQIEEKRLGAWTLHVKMPFLTAAWEAEISEMFRKNQLIVMQQKRCEACIVCSVKQSVYFV